MTSIIADIQVVRSLRKDIRDLVVPANILNAIETIHTCIKSGTDLNGWKKVEWRGEAGRQADVSARGGAGSRSNYGGARSSGDSRSYGGGGGFLSNRQHAYVERSDRPDSYSSQNSYHHAFGTRTKINNSNRTMGKVEQIPASIPLTNTVVMPTESVPTSVPVPAPVPDVKHTVDNEGFRTPHQKYVSKFKKSSEKVEDKILNTIILGKLNKFSELNYNEIKEFITYIIDSGETEMIKCFMKLVFEKAASEEMFCPLYAKLLSELSALYPVLLTEMANLYSQYMDIFEEVVETTAENYNEVCKRNVEKKYRRGYSQFLAELIKYDVINSDLLYKTIEKITTQIELNSTVQDAKKLNEEFADCFMKIMKAIPEKDRDSPLNAEIRIVLKGKIFERVQPLSIKNADIQGISNKARFTLLDICEMIKKS
jgi:hypothetical protein